MSVRSRLARAKRTWPAHGVSPKLLARWQRLAAAAAPDGAEQAEIIRLRAELRRVEQERDILKKS